MSEIDVPELKYCAAIYWVQRQPDWTVEHDFQGYLLYRVFGMKNYIRYWPDNNYWSWTWQFPEYAQLLWCADWWTDEH